MKICFISTLIQRIFLIFKVYIIHSIVYYIIFQSFKVEVSNFKVRAS